MMRPVALALMASVAFVTVSGCAEKPGVNTAKLFTGEQITAADVAVLKQKKCLGENEKAQMLYTTGGVKRDGLLLTDSKVVAYMGDRVEKAALSDIYDLSLNLADTLTEPGRITVFRRDNTEFVCEVYGGAAGMDQAFYGKLLNAWQEKKPSETAAKPASPSDTGGTMIGVKPPAKAGDKPQPAGPKLEGPATIAPDK